MHVRIPPDRSLFPSDLSLSQHPERWPWRSAPTGASRTFPAARFRKEATGLRLEAHDNGRLTVGLFDTFDWAIVRTGAVAFLVRRSGDAGGELVLVPSDTGKSKPASTVAAALAQEAGPHGRIGWFEDRAVLPLGEAEIQADRFRILDGNDKQVGWLDRVALVLDHADASGTAAATPVWVRLLPLRGFDHALAGLLSDLDTASPTELAGVLAARIDRAALDYPIDQAASISPETPIHAGVSRMLDALRRTAEANQPYLMDPPDVEFLHHYRVAMRRMRTLARVLERCGIANWFGVNGTDLKAWMAVTSPARDVDVFRQDVYALRAELPERLAQSMLPLEESLSREGKVAHQAIVEQLRSSTPPWRAWSLERPTDVPQEPSDQSARFSPSEPMKKLAAYAVRWERKRFEKALHQVAAQGGPASESLDTMLHQLRIRVKRYRYALDLFGVALPKGGGKPKELKRLQDRLGAYHDLVVRRRRLSRYVEPGPHAATLHELAAHASAAGALFLVTESDLATQRERLMKELRRRAPGG